MKEQDHGTYYWMIDMVNAMCDHLNEMLEQETLLAADLVDALASTDLRLAFDSDGIMPGIYARLLKEGNK